MSSSSYSEFDIRDYRDQYVFNPNGGIVDFAVALHSRIFREDENCPGICNCWMGDQGESCMNQEMFLFQVMK